MDDLVDIRPQPEVKSEADACCIAKAALQVLTVPVIATDGEQVLVSNGAWDRRMSAGVSSVGRPIEDFIADEILEAARERWRCVIDGGVTLDEVRTRGRDDHGRHRHAVASLERIDSADGRRVMLVATRRLDEEEFYTLRPRTRMGRRKPADAFACMHAAMLEALPFPVIITRGPEVALDNLQARLMFAGGSTMIGRPTLDFVHPDSAAAASQRRDLLHASPHTIRDITLKVPIANGADHLRIDVVSFPYGDGTLGMSIVRGRRA